MENDKQKWKKLIEKIIAELVDVWNICVGKVLLDVYIYIINYNLVSTCVPLFWMKTLEKTI